MSLPPTVPNFSITLLLSFVQNTLESIYSPSVCRTKMSPSSFLVSSILALSTLTSLPSVVSAQQSASIFIVNADTQPLVGSIVGTVRLRILLREQVLKSRPYRKERPLHIRSNAAKPLIQPNAVSQVPSPTLKRAVRASSMQCRTLDCRFLASYLRTSSTDRPDTGPPRLVVLSEEPQRPYVLAQG